MAAQSLFAWATLEDSPSLGTIRQSLEAIPDAALLQGLRHPSHEACLAELRRNPSLRRLLGVEAEAQIPHHWNLSRFLDVLGHPVHLAAIHDCFDRMVQRLVGVVPDLGRRLAGDATALNVAPGGDATQRRHSDSAGCEPESLSGKELRPASLEANGPRIWGRLLA